MHECTLQASFEALKSACRDVQLEAQATAAAMQEELCATMQCQPGFVCNKKDLTADLRNFMNWGIFKDVQARVTDKSKDGKVRPVLLDNLDFSHCPPESEPSLCADESHFHLHRVRLSTSRELHGDAL